MKKTSLYMAQWAVDLCRNGLYIDVLAVSYVQGSANYVKGAEKRKKKLVVCDC